MNKIFALFAAVGVALCASAAPAVSVIDVEQANADLKSHKVNTEHKVAQLGGITTISVADLAEHRAAAKAAMTKPARTAPHKAIAAPTGKADYLHTAFGFFGETDFEQDVYSTYTIGVSKIEFDGDKVYIDGLFGAETTIEGTYNAISGGVTIPMGQMTTIEGIPVTFYIFNTDELEAYDLVFKYDPVNYSLTYETDEEFTESIFVAPEEFDGSGYFNYYFEVFGAYFNEVNSYMTWTISKQGQRTDMVSYIYAETDPAATILSIGNPYGGFNYDFFFWIDCNLDLEAKTATANSQVVTVTSDGQSDFYLWSRIDGKFRAIVTYDYTFETAADGDYTLLTKDEVFIAYVSGSTANGYYVYDSKIYVPFVIEPAGLESVVAAGGTAPVEYFNLQGMRVAEPANGIYIRRQGDNVSKIYVK